jgi:hypothetical protein
MTTMENTLEEKSLAHLIQNPHELSAIISDPGKAGLEFYWSLRNKDKSYVAFAAGIGLLAYGIYLSRTGSGSKAASSGNQGGSSQGKALAASNAGSGAQGNASSGEGNAKPTSDKELDVKKNRH